MTSCTVLPVSGSPLGSRSCLNGHFVAEGCYRAELFANHWSKHWQDTAQHEQVDWSERRLCSAFASELPVGLNTRVDLKVIQEYLGAILVQAGCIFLCICMCIHSIWRFVLHPRRAVVTARRMVMPLRSHSRMEHQITMRNNIAKLICNLRCSVCPVSVSVGQSDLLSLPLPQFKQDKNKRNSSGGCVRHNTHVYFCLWLLLSWTTTSLHCLFRFTTGFPTKWWRWRWTSWAAIAPTCWGRCSSWTDSTIPASWGQWVEEAAVRRVSWLLLSALRSGCEQENLLKHCYMFVLAHSLFITTQSPWASLQRQQCFPVGWCKSIWIVAKTKVAVFLKTQFLFPHMHIIPFNVKHL